MSQEKIVKYLQDNKGKYSKEDLIAELEKFGYSKLEIETASVIVYGNQKVDSKHVIGKSVALGITGIGIFMALVFGVIILIWLMVYINVGILGNEFI